MEAGKTAPRRHRGAQARPDRPDDRRGRPIASPTPSCCEMEEAACPTCGSCSRHVHRQLDELPGRGDRPRAAGQRHHARHARRARRRSSSRRARWSWRSTKRYYDARRRVGAAAHHRHPGRVRERHGARRRDGRLDQHDPAPARRRPRGRRRLRPEGDRRAVPAGALPVQGRARAPRSYHVEDVHRAGGIPAILGELDRAGLLNRDVHTRPRRLPRATTSTPGTSASLAVYRARRWSCATRRPAVSAPSRPSRSTPAGSRSTSTARTGCIRDVEHAYTARRRPGRALRQHRARGLHREDRRASTSRSGGSQGPAVVFESPGRRRRGHPRRQGQAPATSWSSATRAPRAGPACRRCSTHLASSRAGGWARPAR